MSRLQQRAAQVIPLLNDFKKTYGVYPELLTDLNTKKKYYFAYSQYSHTGNNESEFFLTVNAAPFPVFKTYNSAIKDWRIWSNAREFQQRMLAPIEADFKKAETHYRKGNQLKQSGLIDEAMAEYTKALEINSKFINARLGLAYLFLAEKEDLDNALIQYKKVLRQDRTSYEAYFNSSLIYFRRERFEESLDDYKQFMRYVPDQTKKEKAESLNHLQFLEDEIQGRAAIKKVSTEKVSLPDKDIQAALYSAADAGNEDVIIELLGNPSIDINAANGRGLTALHMAAGRGHMNIVKILIEHSANTYKMDKTGQTAAHHARFNGHTEIYNYLKEL